MNTTPQFQDFPNPNPNPNFEDQFAYTTHHHDQLNNLMYFRDISNYLMSDEGSEGLTTELHSKIISENTVDFFDKSSSSAPFTHNIKRTRKVKIYKAQEEFRLAFRTRSDLDVMDDGFKWRKYGKKKVKNSPNPR
ncbi:putative WRKY transcription factor 51 [Sesamum alatum]|uniref:WRKY transcription factor 51 n=1 Tax=Sesamum alatum TaxID=300844 RepID=A0AAE2CCS3_9LAMI|nr:putative WRKY transcription factor 51 [Sesamum alatum]